MASSKKKAVPGSSASTGRRKTGGTKKAQKKTAARGAAKSKKSPARKKAASKKKAPTRQAVKKATAKKAQQRAAGRRAAKKKVAPRPTAKKATAKKKPAAKKKATAKKKPAARKKAAAKKGAARKATAKKATAKKATARKPAGRSARKKVSTRKAAPKTGRKTARSASSRAPGRGRRVSSGAPPEAIPGLNEEDQIRSAKYLPRDLPKRLFEEDRFMFPESYGVNRVRLLVRDPDWVFAYWDVSPETMKGLAKSLGERALALSRLTLRVLDPVSGGQSDILLPPGARWWYIRTDAARRTYRAEIGITLPSGEFRQLAESNSVVTPRVGPSRERALRKMSYRGASQLPPEEAEAAGRAERESGLSRDPWVGAGAGSRERGGASDVFGPGGDSSRDRPGASDSFRPGASDSFRR